MLTVLRFAMGVSYKLYTGNVSLSQSWSRADICMSAASPEPCGKPSASQLHVKSKDPAAMGSLSDSSG